MMRVDDPRSIAYQLAFRRWSIGAFAVVLGAALTTARVTVPNIMGEPGVPPTRIYLLLGCAAASAAVLALRPVLPGPERIAARNMRIARAWLLVGTVGLAMATAFAVGSVIDPAYGVRGVAACAALIGLGLAAHGVSLFLGLVLPWIYVIAGLGFGYDTNVAGPSAQVRPWAWIIDDSVLIAPQLLLFAAGALVFILVSPREGLHST